MNAAFDTADPDSWPDETLILRGGIGRADDLARRVDSADEGWSVQAQPHVELRDLARFLPNNRFRRTTMGRLRTAGGSLATTPGPGYHRSLRGITPEAFDSILEDPESNPFPPEQRWPNQ